MVVVVVMTVVAVVVVVTVVRVVVVVLVHAPMPHIFSHTTPIPWHASSSVPPCSSRSKRQLSLPA